MPTLTEEDERALLFQRQERSRAAFRSSIAQRPGNEAAAQRVRDAWMPVILARREAHYEDGSDEPEKGSCQ